MRTTIRPLRSSTVLVAAVSAIFLTQASAQAQQVAAASTTATPLSDVVVTATRTPTRIDDLTNDVTVIDRAQLDRGGATLREVFRSVPGVEINQTGGQGNALQISIRGTNSDHVLVLVDGMRLGSASLGTTAFENMPLDNIERIEILRGPASSLYGSSAIGGVIQIFTRSGAGNPGVNFSAGYGSYNTARTSFGTGYEKDGLRYALQFGATDTDGITSNRNPRAIQFNADADGYRNINLSAQIAKDFGDGREIGFKGMQSNGLARFDSSPVPANDFRTYSNLGDYILHGRAKIGERWNTHLSWGISTDDSRSYTSANNNAVIRTVQHQVIWQNDFKLPVGALMAAYENLTQRVDGTTIFPVNNREVETLALGYQAGIGAHHLQFSGRRDLYDQFGARNTGYAGYGYDISREFRATIGTGTAFKAPSFNQLYFPGFGNPLLLPESSRNSEVGLQYNGSRVRLGVVHFYNRVKNLIVNAGVPLAPRNVGEARIRGTTLTATTRAWDTNFSAALNFQDPRDAATGLMLTRRAQKFMTLGADREALGGKMGVDLYAASPRFNDTPNVSRMGGYTLLGAYFDRRINPEWSWFLRGDNLTNKSYETAQSSNGAALPNVPFSFNSPGRSVFLGVRYQEK